MNSIVSSCLLKVQTFLSIIGSNYVKTTNMKIYRPNNNIYY